MPSHLKGWQHTGLSTCGRQVWRVEGMRMRVTVFPPNSQNAKEDRQGPSSGCSCGPLKKALAHDNFHVVEPSPVYSLSALFTRAHLTTHPWVAVSLTSLYR